MECYISLTFFSAYGFNDSQVRVFIDEANRVAQMMEDENLSSVSAFHMLQQPENIPNRYITTTWRRVNNSPNTDTCEMINTKECTIDQMLDRMNLQDRKISFL